MRRVAAWTFVLLIAASRAHGDDTSHVRADSSSLQAVLTEAALDSPTVSSLVDRIRASNVIAHVECARFRSFTLQGRTLFVLATRDVRYVRVQVDCLRPRPELAALIGHELQHVAEIAAAPDVVDQRSFVRLLNTIGFLRTGTREASYETEAALLAEAHVIQEMTGRHGLWTKVISLTRATVAETPASSAVAGP
jgi:hypothetical protein